MTSYVPLIESVPVLSSLYENVYANEENMRKSISPVINAQTFKLNLPSVQMGTQVAVDLPLGPLLGTTVLALNLGQVYSGGPTPVLLPRSAGLELGWGFTAVSRYIVQLDGGSPLTYFGRHVLISHMAACETGEKRNQLLALAGPQYDGSQNVYEDLIAYIPIHLPWSNVSASRHLMYDSSILTKAVNITFELASPQDLFLVTSTDRPNVTLPTSYKEAYLMCNSAILAKGPIASIRNSVSALGDSRYTFPFMYPSAFESTPFVGIPKSNPGGGQNSVFLNNFRSGSVQSIDLFLLRTSLADGATGPGAPLSNTWNGDNVYVPLVEVELRYGGQTILRSPSKIQQMFNLSNYTTADSFSTNQFNLFTGAISGGNTANIPNAVRSTWLHIQLSQLNEAYITNLIQDGVQLQNNMMEVVFNTPEIRTLSNGQTTGQNPAAPIVPTAQPTYVLLANYNYQTSVSTYKGFTDFVFVNPAVAAGPYTMAT